MFNQIKSQTLVSPLVFSLFFALLTLLFFSSNVNAKKSDGDKALTSAKVEEFLKVNRSNLLFVYSCIESDSNRCHVYCSSGGAEFLSQKQVRTAYYAERLKKLDGSLAGFFLVLEHGESTGLWATLQTQSSCYFDGMAPSRRVLSR